MLIREFGHNDGHREFVHKLGMNGADFKPQNLRKVQWLSFCDIKMDNVPLWIDGFSRKRERVSQNVSIPSSGFQGKFQVFLDYEISAYRFTKSVRIYYHTEYAVCGSIIRGGYGTGAFFTLDYHRRRSLKCGLLVN